jgi:hypothetical protein
MSDEIETKRLCRCGGVAAWLSGQCQLCLDAGARRSRAARNVKRARQAKMAFGPNWRPA